MDGVQSANHSRFAWSVDGVARIVFEKFKLQVVFYAMNPRLFEE